jgi:hypothetical protein
MATVAPANDAVAAFCVGVPFTTMSALVNCEPACTTAANCPGSTTACQIPTCTGGQCGFASVAEGTPCTDNGGTICTGAGTCVPFTFDVLRIGTGDAGTLTAAAAPVYLEQRLVADGGLVRPPILLPTSAPDAGQNAFVSPGIALIAGLSRSQDGHYLSLAGYSAAVGSANPANSADAIVVARVDSNGNVDTSTTFSSASNAFHSLNSVRTATSADGNEFWVGGVGASVDGGSTGGIWYIPFGIVDGQQINASPVRLLGVSGNQLYGTGDIDAGQVFSIEGGLPTTGPAALTTLPGLPMTTPTSASPWQFVFLKMNAASPGPDTLYVANDRAFGSNPMGIERFQLQSGQWGLTAVLTTPSPDGGTPPGFRGLAGLNVGGTATLVATSVETPTRIIVFTDDGVSSPWTGTSRVIAVGNDTQMLYRGVALAPHP